MERPEHFQSIQTGNAFKPPFPNNNLPPINQPVQSYEMPVVEDVSGIKTSQVQFQMNPVQKVYIVENGKPGKLMLMFEIKFLIFKIFRLDYTIKPI